MQDVLGSVSTERAAAMLGVHPNTVRARIERGEIPASEAPGKGRKVYRIPLSALVDTPHKVAPETVAFWRDQWVGAMQEFVGDFQEMMDLAHTLGAERARRRQLQHLVDDLREELAEARTEIERLRTERLPHADEFVPSEAAMLTAKS